jgi:polysaccharide export outer membrane protein
MRYGKASILMVLSLAPAFAQQQSTSSRVGSGAAALSYSANLPVEKIGSNDLLGITVYDEPELTRTIRVNSEGDIRLPMLRQRIRAAGLYPAELETAITNALTSENVMVEPIVTVTVVEYRSRPISVVGAVKNPITFQATGTTTLLEALSQAQGLTDNAGPDILVTRSRTDPAHTTPEPTQRIPVKMLLSGEDSPLNLHLEGGEEIRVPEAGRIFVVGNVKKPGAFLITDGPESSVLKALALSEGLDSFSGHVAYIYRVEGSSGARREIQIELKKILSRKSPDVPLFANDMLYIPDAAGLRASVKTLETVLGIGTSLSSAVIYTTVR